MVGLFSASAFAESIPQEEIDQFSGSSKPDVDASASKGADATVVKQEKNQLDNSMGTNVPEPSMKGGELCPRWSRRASPVATANSHYH